MVMNACEKNIIDAPNRDMAPERLFRSYINHFVKCGKLDITENICLLVQGLTKDSSGYFYDVRRILLLISALVLFQINLNAQDIQNAGNKLFCQSLWGSIEVGYGRSFEKDYAGYNMYLASFRAKIGYYLTPQFSLGVGAGLNGYHNYSINTLPVVLDIRYHPIKTLSNLYAYADIGASIIDSYKTELKTDFTSGFLSDMGLGYKIRLRKRTFLSPAVGYNLFVSVPRVHNYDNYSYTEHITRHTIFLRVGFQF
jgi:hypothetical protein